MKGPKTAWVNCVEVTRSGTMTVSVHAVCGCSAHHLQGLRWNGAQGMGMSILVDRSSGRQTNGEEMGGDVVGR